MISVGGMDAGDAGEIWMNLTREEVAQHPDFDERIGEYLDYLSTDGMRYFLPALLELALLSPEKVDDGGLFYLTARLKEMWTRPPEHRYYRGTRLSRAQVDAIRTWCELIQDQAEGLQEYEIGHWSRLKSLKTVQEIREHLPSALNCVDYDADYRQKLQDEATKHSGRERPRRHGWQHEENKKGKRPRNREGES